uniref:Potassium channel tetramerisation-type BTB domain-containing protein n=1 Tax=Arcella intermedia TaxID=1963864 RepID=A0A6B2LEQ8_9EUKA
MSRTMEGALLDGCYFIDRDGKYFEPILEFLRTGDVVVPKNMNLNSVIREAEFFGIKFPLAENSQYLDYITDDWLIKTKGDLQYGSIRNLADSILTDVLREFKSSVEKGSRIVSNIYLRQIQDSDMMEFAHNLARSAQKLHETQDIKTAVQSEVVKFYKDWPNTVLNQDYFDCLADVGNREVIIQYFKRHKSLSVEIVPKTIKINWKGTSKDWIAGYYFIHSHDLKHQKIDEKDQKKEEY